MAVAIHVARVGVLSVNGLGNVVKKDDPNVTIGQHLETSMDHRVLEDSAIPNSNGNPAVKTYLELEAANDFVLQHIDQTTIITYKRDTNGGFPAP